MLLYLNDCADGGATQLLRAEQADATELDDTGAKVARSDHVLHAVRPVCGRGLMYWHQVLHAGERVGAGSVKYCLRTVRASQDPNPSVGASRPRGGRADEPPAAAAAVGRCFCPAAVRGGAGHRRGPSGARAGACQH